jgi:hypothetical protein
MTEVNKMKKVAAFLTLLVVILTFASTILAEEEGEEFYITGVVTGYSKGKSITVKGDEGTYNFAISKDTGVYGDVKVGTTVEVEAKDGLAVNIWVSDMEEEHPAPEEQYPEDSM